MLSGTDYVRIMFRHFHDFRQIAFIYFHQKIIKLIIAILEIPPQRIEIAIYFLGSQRTGKILHHIKKLIPTIVLPLEEYLMPPLSLLDACYFTTKVVTLPHGSDRRWLKPPFLNWNCRLAPRF